MQLEIAVIGLGAMGSAALWRLATRGVAAVGFEQFEPGHDRGSSHGESRIIRSAYYEGSEYVPLVQRAFTLWRELERASGADILGMTGALMIGRPERDLVTGALASARDHGLAYELLDAVAAQQRFPQHRLPPDVVAVYEPDAGVLRPETAVRAMIAQAERAGARVYRRTAVESVEPSADGVRISAGGRSHAVRHAIVAAGPWLPRLLPDLPVRLAVERQVVASFPVRDPAAFSPARCPVFMHEIAAGEFRYGFPTLDSATIKLGVHHGGAITTPDTVERAVHPSDLAPLQHYIRASLAGVETDAVRAQVCLYTNAPDEHFILGALPAYPGLTLLSACSGHGFKFAPVLGDAAADLALRGATAYPIARFTPARFGM